ncbi:MAG TPA: hypothetical protein VGJ97_04565 [Anaerolineaceae bacterium]
MVLPAILYVIFGLIVGLLARVVQGYIIAYWGLPAFIVPLGGTSPLGGVGTIPGALIDALIIASLTTGLQMLNVAPAWQYVVKAIILIAAVYIDVYFKKHR